MKKIKKIAIIILMTTLFIIISSSVEASTGKVKTEATKLRKKADSSSTILDLLEKDKEVEIIEDEGNWYKVKATTELGKVTGYVNKENIEIENIAEEEPQENEKIINTEIVNDITTTIEVDEIEEGKKYTISQEINLKAMPLINSIIKNKINGEIEVIEILNDWARIESETEIGWARINEIKAIISQETTEEDVTNEKTVDDQDKKEEEKKSEETQKNEETQKQEVVETEINKIGYVNAEGLVVRESATTESKELDSLSRNDEVKIIGQTGKWYKIDLNGKTGYVSSKYISDTKVVETTSRSGSVIEQPEITAQELITEENISTTGEEIVEYAKQYLGYKYVSGGETAETGFDCSGFTKYVFKHFGITLNRTSSGQNKNGVSIEKENLQLGDIVIFNNEANTSIGHVGIYVGNGNFIHASNQKDGIKITTLSTGYYQKRYVGARRVI